MSSRAPVPHATVLVMRGIHEWLSSIQQDLSHAGGTDHRFSADSNGGWGNYYGNNYGYSGGYDSGYYGGGYNNGEASLASYEWNS